MSLGLFLKEFYGFGDWFENCLSNKKNVIRKRDGADGHQVLVIPGFLAGDDIMSVLRQRINNAGFSANPWLGGINTGPHQENLDLILASVRSLYRESGERVSIVGWSLGGAMAMAAAQIEPNMIRRVITLGAPLSADPKDTNIKTIFELVSGYRADHPKFKKMAKGHHDVPVTAIVAGLDGVVVKGAEGCGSHPKLKTIKINKARHISLPIRLDVARVIINELMHK